MNQLITLPILILLVLCSSFSISQDCDGVFDELYFELIPYNNQGEEGGAVAEGTIFHIEVRSINFSLTSFQYTIAYDTAKLSLVVIDGLNSELNGSVSYYESTKGKIGVIWTQDQGEIDILPDGSLLFNIQFTSLVSEDDCLPLTLTNTPVEAELGTFDAMNNVCFSLAVNNFFFNPPLCNYVDPNDMDFDGFTFDEDCDDNNPNINPDAVDFCDGIDNNCNGEIDEELNFILYYADNDGDGYGNPLIDTIACEYISGWVLNMDDCDDNDENINPEAYDCDDGIDNDCDGEIDELSENIYFLDADGDGFGTDIDPIVSCLPIEGYVVVGLVDCDDNDPTINPDAEDICDDIDNNCNGEIDEETSFISYYADNDGDGFGDLNTEVLSCDVVAGYVTNYDDCDDNNEAINPNVAEVPGNEIDEDCDGMDGVVSTKEQFERQLKIFPNPALDFVQIQENTMAPCELKIYNQQGVLIHNYKIETGESKIYLGDILPGLYIYILSDERHTQSMGKLLKL